MVEIPLGPAVGQCCGGHVPLRLHRAGAAEHAELDAAGAAAEAACQRCCCSAPAMSAAPSPRRWRPCRCDCTGSTPGPTSSRPRLRRRRRRSIVTSARWPRSSDAPAGSATFVLTHSHALDFELCSSRPRARRLRLSRPDRLRDQARQFERSFRDLRHPAGADRRHDLPDRRHCAPRQAPGRDRRARRGGAAGHVGSTKRQESRRGAAQERAA